MFVCVLGTGTMGSGIASLFCASTAVSKVIVWGRSQSSLDSCYLKIQKELSRYAKQNSVSSESLSLLISKITLQTELSELQGCNLYIEAISENLDSKIELFSSLKSFIPDSAIVATNTSSLSVTGLAMQVNNPANFIGIHFFNPTSIMKLVELIKGLLTSDETLDKAIKLVEMLEKKHVVVKESPGFIVNRMLIPMINEAIGILAEGVASKLDIDNAMKYGANHPIGPLGLSDLIGNDVCLSIMDTLHKETGDQKYRAHPLLRQYVRAGLMGRKSGEGFYEYSK